ncbi:ribosome biogenesis GTP-binding protein YihA/YsxC [Alicyclobacillus macrosporangiidus]|uniref:ribosome biogenesis GTP-binding protein YihA/YsxC n=1 Tax=Alicyclobacillus macrosporangiidus TaxID=392015 RepID=UPI0026EB6D5E|nr:ribosome biogenesis GTP-binding protein YihA/YsxC [Alicyclobacillus macrosporangiidus]
MKVRSAEFEISAVRPSQWPGGGLPEFAFVGRSNVGKSSLLNALLQRKSLARVSATPGKTQQINFYRVNDAFRFVDLPGYGYAAVSKSTRGQFARFIETYLTAERPLLRVMHLIDIRHEPTALDVQMHRWLLQLELPVCIVATKRDKISRGAIQAHTARIRKALNTPWPMVAVSAVHRDGLEALWKVLDEDLERWREGPPVLEPEADLADVDVSEQTGTRRTEAASAAMAERPSRVPGPEAGDADVRIGQEHAGEEDDAPGEGWRA